ncbi:Ribonuclease 1 [Citrus sinensis]|uniref:Ribonuclease 1 n=1 Tax=Citrus sinensis TaxID=2711 RepID=A0ACB8J082_CITSI|nr:Ribonuclease 1 [Citrus sinensis]
MKAAYLLSFVLLVLYIISGAVRNCSGHDHFLLVQTWPNGYCSIVNCHDSPLNFVLHGLWPVDRNGTSLHNYTTPSIRMIDILNRDTSLKSDMGKYWPSLISKISHKFWSRQWQKHGSAQKLITSPEDYFRTAIRLMKITNLQNKLAAKGIVPNGTSYPKDYYKSALEVIHGGESVMLACFSVNGIQLLRDVYICLDGQLRYFISCNKNEFNKTENCGDDIMFPSKVQISSS